MPHPMQKLFYQGSGSRICYICQWLGYKIGPRHSSSLHKTHNFWKSACNAIARSQTFCYRGWGKWDSQFPPMDQISEKFYVSKVFDRPIWNQTQWCSFTSMWLYAVKWCNFSGNIGGSKHMNPVILPLKMPATITNHILGGIVWWKILFSETNSQKLPECKEV